MNRKHILFPAYRTILHISTFVSFLLIFVFLLLFVQYAPGNYHIGLDISSAGPSNLDIIFSLLLMINNICAILSFVEFLKQCYVEIHEKLFLVKWFGPAMLDIYPILIICVLCGWNSQTLLLYLLSPIRILFPQLRHPWEYIFSDTDITGNSSDSGTVSVLGIATASNVLLRGAFDIF